MTDISPVKFSRVYRRDATPALGVVLYGRDIRTGRRFLMPRATDVIRWVMRWPQPRGVETKTTQTDGGLKVDPRTGRIAYPITQEDVQGLQPGATTTFTVYVVDGADRITPYVDGAISAEGTP